MLAQLPPHDDVAVPYRRLRGYSFDPSLSIQLDTALVNEAVFKIPWEGDLQPGPIGEYLEVIDYDPASKSFYEPVDLNHRNVLAIDGLAPSEGNPKFHQQMVYAVAMTTIKNFEKALGRSTLWSSFRREIVPGADGKSEEKIHHDYIQRLRIYPHALRQANAYYSPAKKALLFGYFPAATSAPGDFLPNGLVFTCLSHDIIAHETTHALLDGMHRRFIEPSHRDTLAFHEAFADIVALFQHFTFPEVLKHQIAKTRGRLDSQNLLGELAQQFGKAIGRYGALRRAIGEMDPEKKTWRPKEPTPDEYQNTTEPHARGAILVAAIFETFLSIYKCRVADLLRIATGGTGILPEGELHPDLVNRMAGEAAKTAQHILNMCIRALDYCPPVDISFGDYMRAIITADMDLVPDDELGYRIALIDAFKRRGIYPRDIPTLSPESLRWKKYTKDESNKLTVLPKIASQLRGFVHQLGYLDEIPGNIYDHYRNYFEKLVVGLPTTPEHVNVDQGELATCWEQKNDREKIFILMRSAGFALHEELETMQGSDADSDEVQNFERTTGLYFLKSELKARAVTGLEVSKENDKKYKFEVHSVRGARRIAPDGRALNQVIISITQKRMVPSVKPGEPDFRFRGGCTLILDLQDLTLEYAIVKTIGDKVDAAGKVEENARLQRQRKYRQSGERMSLRETYFGASGQDGVEEPFALLHSSF